MNRTLLRLSTQALFGRRRGVVLVLIAAALLVLAVLVRLLTDEDVGLDAVVGLGFTLAPPRPYSAPRSTTARSSTCSPSR